MKPVSIASLAALTAAFLSQATAAPAWAPTTNGPPAAGMFVSVYQNQQHFAYLDGSGNIEDAFFDGSRWHLQRINNHGTTAGPAAASSPVVSVYQNQQHFAYLDGAGDIEDAFFDGQSWHLQKLNNGGATAGPAAAGNLFASVYENQQHFAYLDHAGNVEDAFFDGRSWHLQRINNGGATNGPEAAGNLFVSVYTATAAAPFTTGTPQQHFAYLDRAGNIVDAFFDGSRWHLQRINNGGTTAGPAAADSLFVSVYAPTPFTLAQQHFAYIDHAGNVQDAFYDGRSWHLERVNNAGNTDGPGAVGGLFLSVYGSQHHFAYMAANGDLADCFYDSNGNHWNSQVLNDGGATGGVPVFGQIFVSVYKNQQHFAYIDYRDTLQDAFYDGGWHLQQITTQLPVSKGSIPLKFMVMAVVYALPGSTSTHGQETSVLYQNTSTLGTSSSVSHSVKQGYAVSADVSALGSGLSANFSTSQDKTDSSEVDVSKSSSYGISVTGTADGIDHDNDQIWLLLNPVMVVSVTGKNLAWALSHSGTQAEVQYVTVGWLKQPSTMEAGVAASLRNAGITPADYPELLARDPFANGSTSIDTSRFAPANQSFPYEQQNVCEPYTFSNDTIDKSSNSETKSDSFSVTLKTGFDAVFVKASFSNTASFSWSNTSTYGTSTESKQQASATVCGPSPSWAGGTNVDVYYDRIYSSFLFAFDPASVPSTRDQMAAVRGTVTRDGKLVPHMEVALQVGGKTFRTYTNAHGVYYLFHAPRGAATIAIGGVAEPITIGARPVIHDRVFSVKILKPLRPGGTPAAGKATAQPGVANSAGAGSAGRITPPARNAASSPGACAPSYPQSPPRAGTRVLIFNSTTDASGAQVYLDGRCQGVMRQEVPGRDTYSLMVVNVPPGNYAVTIRMPGSADFRTMVHVIASNRPAEQTPKILVAYSH
ncbi:MAG TPA: hypothetical protein VMV31_03950 [Terriglobales bacterium]|nr:hypothetical protein [Terriglobales bacterium]